MAKGNVAAALTVSIGALLMLGTQAYQFENATGPMYPVVIPNPRNITYGSGNYTLLPSNITMNIVSPQSFDATT